MPLSILFIILGASFLAQSLAFYRQAVLVQNCEAVAKGVADILSSLRQEAIAIHLLPSFTDRYYARNPR